jgi:hypothetical protein
MTTPAETKRPAQGGLLRLLAIGFGIAALVKELRLPRDQRAWHGTVATYVPYDFRPPTPERIRQRLWAPDDPQVLMPTVFGVGWSLNFGRIVALLRDRNRR